MQKNYPAESSLRTTTSVDFLRLRLINNNPARISTTGQNKRKSEASIKNMDGLTNSEEKELGTDPQVADTDGDGLLDGEEFNTYKTDPLNPDSDSDGLTDSEEVKTHKTNPNSADSDDDTLGDKDEVMTHGTDPNKADTDDDGLGDADELNTHETDPKMADMIIKVSKISA